MTSTSRTIDVAGVAVRVVAADAPHAACATDRLGAVATEDAPEFELILGPDPPTVDRTAPAQELENWTAHEAGGVVWIGAGTAWARIDGRRVEVGGPVLTPGDEDAYDDLLQFAIAVAVAGPSRLMVHAAVVARGAEALLLVGRSGSGKSTLAAAALLGGWSLMGDDLAIIDTTTMDVRAVSRAPMVPLEIAERHGLEGTIDPGERRRVRLPLERVTPGVRRLIGIVAVGHGDDGHVEVLGAGDVEVLDDALAVPPFRGVIRRQLAAGAALVNLPAVSLLHSSDLAVRVDRATALLDEAWTALGGRPAQ